MEVDIKTAKPGILYRVFSGKIDKIDFVRYYERTIGCYEYQQHSNHPHWNLGLVQSDCDYREHFFENLEDAKQFVIDNCYGGEIQKLKKESKK